MSIWKNLAAGARSILSKDRVERDMDEELRGFMDASAADKERGGMSPDAARRAARVEMGSANAVKHHIRASVWETSLEILLQDLRYATRTLMHSPGFALVAVLSLALGIGANTAIFTLLNQVMLQKLAVRAPGELVTFGKSFGSGFLGGIDLGFADMFTPDFAQQLEANPGPFHDVAAYSSFSPRSSVRVSGNGPLIQAPTSVVTGNYFSALGVNPMLGRTLYPTDAQAPGSGAVAVVSHHFWQQSLSSDPRVIGRPISVNGTQFTIVGVMGETFHGITQELDPPDLWVPVTMAAPIYLVPDLLQPRSYFFLHMFARRSPANTLASDQIWLDHQIRDYVRAGEGGKIAPDRQKEIERISVALTPGAYGVSMLRRRYADSLQMLMAVVAIVLLIACANLANFLLARMTARRRENATRLALGSSRGRIVRQNLIESLLLSFAGGALGLAVAFVATRALIAFVALGSSATPLDPRPDAAVLLFTMAVSLSTALLFGLAPALGAARISAAPALTANTRTAAAGGGRASRFWPRALVTAQVMLSLLLLVGAGLFLRSLHNLQSQDFGFDREHMLIADFDAHAAGYKPEQAPGLNERLLDRLKSIPGVRSEALSGLPPVSFGQWRAGLVIPGYKPAPKEDTGSALNRVTGAYFETTGIAIVAGRPILPSDTASSQNVCVINEQVAKHFFPKGDAIGRTLSVTIDSLGGSRVIVGIARDTKFGNPRDDADRMVYIPLAQIVDKNGVGINDSFSNAILLRTAGDPAQETSALRAAVADVDPNLPLQHVRTIGEHLEIFMGTDRLISRLTAIFASLALLLACTGLYGVLNYSVVRRSNEIGIRIALGASSGGVQWMVIEESLAMFGVGVALGLPAALALAREVRSQLFGISPFDPAVFAASVAVIAVVAVFSAWLPARRAAAVDPMTALRCE